MERDIGNTNDKCYHYRIKLHVSCHHTVALHFDNPHLQQAPLMLQKHCQVTVDITAEINRNEAWELTRC